MRFEMVTVKIVFAFQEICLVLELSTVGTQTKAAENEIIKYILYFPFNNQLPPRDIRSTFNFVCDFFSLSWRWVFFLRFTFHLCTDGRESHQWRLIKIKIIWLEILMAWKMEYIKTHLMMLRCRYCRCKFYHTQIEIVYFENACIYDGKEEFAKERWHPPMCAWIIAHTYAH